MKAIWDMKGDIAIQDLITVLREKFGKDYARTTVVTFLTKLASKDFVSTYRVGKYAYAHAEKTEEESREQLAKQRRYCSMRKSSLCV